MRFVARVLSLIFLVFAVLAGLVDAIQSVAASELVLTPLIEAWSAGSPDTLRFRRRPGRRVPAGSGLGYGSCLGARTAGQRGLPGGVAAVLPGGLPARKTRGPVFSLRAKRLPAAGCSRRSARICALPEPLQH
jgi:hypothetical protein